MSFQAYLDNIEAKTGKTPDDFKKLAQKRGLLKEGTKAMEIVSWLKKDFGLGHGHAMAVYAVLTDFKTIKSGPPPEIKKQKVEKPSMKAPAKNIDEYITRQPKGVRPVLENLRKIILSVAPDAKEVISYAMPAFKYHGVLVGFAGWKNHTGFYPWNSRTITEFKDGLKGYETSKGAIQFPLDKPIPITLVKMIVKSRMKENLARESAKKTLPKKSGKKGI